MTRKIHIVLFGPITNLKAGLIGGATISFGHLVEYLEENGEAYTVINTQKYIGRPKSLLNPFYIIGKTLLALPQADVFFLNSSRGGTKFLAPLLYLISFIFSIKFVFRPFGGNIKDYTAFYRRRTRWLFRNTVLRADLIFLQTKELLYYFAHPSRKLSQLSTSRKSPKPALLRGNRPFQKRFIYLGQIMSTKGVLHILEAAQQLDDSYTFHLYGPIRDETCRHQVVSQPNFYQGVLSRDQILPTLSQYDVLLLPTFYEGEGIPGAIIEAYALGIPVISTHWKAIPEIVRSGRTGELINVHSTPQLTRAIQQFTPENYTTYANHARQYFLEQFDTEQVTAKAIQEIKELFLYSKKSVIEPD